MPELNRKPDTAAETPEVFDEAAEADELGEVEELSDTAEPAEEAFTRNVSSALNPFKTSMERSYKPALSHDITVKKMLEEKEKHFDPSLIEVFRCIAKDFEQIYDANKD